jgi:glyoxylase-like metal-dependent hydrolase (beta-lactamase superfamily II)
MSPPDAGGTLSFPHPAPPPDGALIEVAPGVRWLRMPLPFVLNHINLWLVEDGEGWAIIDTGIQGDGIKAVWERVFAEDLGGRPITRVVATHHHPDHVGLAGWLAERWGVELWMSESEFLHAQLLLNAGGPGFATALDAFYHRLGLEAAVAAPLRQRFIGYPRLVRPLPFRFRRLEAGMALRLGERQWQVVVGHGHAPEHVCLHCPDLGVLIAGDQVLPRISPHIGVSALQPESDPLGQYLASLAMLRATIPASTFVLPSHGLPFHGLHERIDQLLALHEERLVRLEAACEKPSTVVTLMPQLFPRTPDDHQLGVALGETLAHLHRAVATGRLQRRERADGVWLFARP